MRAHHKLLLPHTASCSLKVRTPALTSLVDLKSREETVTTRHLTMLGNGEGADESPDSCTHLPDIVEVAVRGGLLREKLLIRVQLLVQPELLLQQHQAVVAEGLGGAHGRDPQHPAGPAIM